MLYKTFNYDTTRLKHAVFTENNVYMLQKRSNEGILKDKKPCSHRKSIGRFIENFILRRFFFIKKNFPDLDKNLGTGQLDPADFISALIFVIPKLGCAREHNLAQKMLC